MVYEFEVDLARTVVETFEVEVEAASLEEANDLVYEVMEAWPDSELVLNRVLRVGVFVDDATRFVERVEYMPEEKQVA